MLERWTPDLKEATKKLREAPQKLRPSEVAKRARHQAKRLRHGGEERLWNLQTDALTRMENALGKAPEKVPLLSRVADAAERFVHTRLEAATAVPLEGYDDLTAKDVNAQISGLDHLALLKVRRHEAANKNRKTVLAALDRALVRDNGLREEAPAEPQTAAEPTPEATPA